MGHLKDIANQPKRQTFPNSTYEIVGQVPASQCSQAVIEGDHGHINEMASEITDVGKFAGWDLVGKWFTIISPAVYKPTQQIDYNTDDIVSGDYSMGVMSNDTVYYIHDGGELILTRDLKSFDDLFFGFLVFGCLLFCLVRGQAEHSVELCASCQAEQRADQNENESGGGLGAA
ncbi:hypothetical protein ES703_125393 [subsurface metagenome]